MWPLALAILAACGATLTGALFVRRAVRGEQCPVCKAPALRNWYFAKANPPMPAYYRCERCGLRLRRRFDGPWEDASLPEHDRFYEDAPPMPLPPTGPYRS
jgi:hypothetical protein